jgi:hypothetical protein
MGKATPYRRLTMKGRKRTKRAVWLALITAAAGAMLGGAAYVDEWTGMREKNASRLEAIPSRLTGQPEHLAAVVPASAARPEQSVQGSPPAVLSSRDPLDAHLVIFNIERSALRLVGSVSDEEGRLHRIYLAPTRDGNTCMFETIELGAAPPGTRLGPQGGGCRPASITGDKIRWTAKFKGSPDDNTGFYIYGVAERGVSGVQVIDSLGKRYEARLGVNRVFFFESPSGSRIEPVAVLALDASGAILKRSTIR